jgi:tRNA (guanine9-N1)-methyltransferase
VSLTSQLAYAYSANRKAVKPFEILLFTSLSGKTLARLEDLGDAGYKRWIGAVWWSDSYERLWKGKESELDENEIRETPAASLGPQTEIQSVVYLTADSSEELTELKEGETYIIGGICDHNRYKVRISPVNKDFESHQFLCLRIFVRIRPYQLVFVLLVFLSALTWRNFQHEKC